MAKCSMTISLRKRALFWPALLVGIALVKVFGVDSDAMVEWVARHFIKFTVV